MPTYQKCHEVSDEVDELLQELIEKGPDHVDLSEAKLTINALFVTPKLDKYGNPTECALKVNRYPALAAIKVTSYKDRIKGMADAELLLDFPHWEKAPRMEKIAILDHELTHLAVIKDEYDRMKSDDCGRPKLKVRLHDVQFGWFSSIARRYGKHSIEIKQATVLFDEFGQAYWPDLFSSTAELRKILKLQREAEGVVDKELLEQAAFKERTGFEPPAP
jgi:hypothetical protein